MKKCILFALCYVSLFLSGCGLPPEIEDGDKAMQAKNYDQASTLYGQASEKYPEEKEYQEKWHSAKKLAAQAHFEQGDNLRKKEYKLKEAIEEFNKALEFQPDLKEASQSYSDVKAYIKMLEEKIQQAKEANERRDWFRSEKILWYHRQYASTFPEIGELWKKASTESYNIRMNEGMRYYYLEKYDVAEKEFEEAVRLNPENEQAKKTLQMTKDRKESDASFFQAIEAMKNGDYPKARTLVEKALKLYSENKRAISLFEEATRKGSKTLLEKAEAMEKQGDLIEAYYRLLDAKDLKPSGKLLQNKIEDRLKHVKKRMASRWYFQANELESKGLYGAAWIRFRQASLIWPGFSNTEERIQKIGKKIPQALQYRLVVLPAGGGSGARKEALKKITSTLTAEFQKKLPNTLFTLYPYTELQGNLVQGMPLSGIIRVKLDQFEIVPTAKKEDKKQTYPATIGKSLNPQKTQLRKVMKEAKQKQIDTQANWKGAQEDLSKKETALKQAQEALDDFKKRNPPKNSLTPQEEASDPRAIKIKELETVIESKRLDLEDFKGSKYPQAQKEFEQAQQSYQQALDNYLKEPTFQEEKHFQTYFYTRLTVTKTGTARIQLVLLDFVSAKTLMEKSFLQTFEKTDSTQEAFPSTGFEKDPLELPNNEEVTKNLIEGLVAQILPQVQTLLQTHQKRFVDAMEQAGKSGALHFAFLSYKSRQDPSYRARNKLSPEEDKQLVEKILELTGYDLSRDALVKEKLKF